MKKRTKHKRRSKPVYVYPVYFRTKETNIENGTSMYHWHEISVSAISARQAIIQAKTGCFVTSGIRARNIQFFPPPLLPYDKIIKGYPKPIQGENRT